MLKGYGMCTYRLVDTRRLASVPGLFLLHKNNCAGVSMLKWGKPELIHHFGVDVG